jgi:hypothetical protein
MEGGAVRHNFEMGPTQVLWTLNFCRFWQIMQIRKKGDEIFFKSSPRKLVSQSQPNFAEMILGWPPSKQFWPFEEISIFSNSSHLEWRAGLSDTILKGTHSGTWDLKKIFSSETTEAISTKLCWNDSWMAPLPKLCPLIPTSNQDGRQAQNRKKGGWNFNCPLLL